MGAHPNSLAALIPFRFREGESGNPGGQPGRNKVREYRDFARGVPFDVIDPATGKPFADPETGETLSRDDLVMQATFRCAIDIRRSDCTRAQLAWNSYVRGTPGKGNDPEAEAKEAGKLGSARVVTYRIPDNGRGPRSDDPKVKTPVTGPMPPVPESHGRASGDDD